MPSDSSRNARPAGAFRDEMHPPLPSQMQSIRSHGAEEIVKMMKTPLFMSSLEDAGGQDDENIELEAIRALQYEGTPAENAQNFKEQGNEMVKAKNWGDAKEFYTKGIAVLSKKIGATEGVASSTSEDGLGEVEKQKVIEEACYVNRALCHLELKNYRSTTLDCASTLRLNPKNVKAYYRSSKALLALDKVTEASDACQHGLSVDSSNSAMKNLMKEISDREAVLRARSVKEKQQTERAQKEKIVLATALRARNIRLRKSAQPPDMEDASVHLAPDSLSPTSSLYFPVLLLYPMHAQSDFVKACSESDTILQHLEYIFPLPWDSEKEYQIKEVELYMETAKGGLIKVGKNMSLLKVLGNDDVEVVDQLVKINVLPKRKAKTWIDEMKMRKGK